MINRKRLNKKSWPRAAVVLALATCFAVMGGNKQEAASRAQDKMAGIPVIDTAHCTGCALCRAACIVEPKAIEIRSLHAKADTK